MCSREVHARSLSSPKWRGSSHVLQEAASHRVSHVCGFPSAPSPEHCLWQLVLLAVGTISQRGLTSSQQSTSSPLSWALVPPLPRVPSALTPWGVQVRWGEGLPLGAAFPRLTACGFPLGWPWETLVRPWRVGANLRQPHLLWAPAPPLGDPSPRTLVSPPSPSALLAQGWLPSLVLWEISGVLHHPLGFPAFPAWCKKCPAINSSCLYTCLVVCLSLFFLFSSGF